MTPCAVRLGRTLISLRHTRLNPQMPRPAMIRIATGGPTCPDRMPIIITPTGPVPMHMDAPWYIIPSNHKWFRNLAVSQIMADTMEALDMAFPKPSVNLAEIRRKYHAAVVEGRERKRSEPSPR